MQENSGGWRGSCLFTTKPVIFVKWAISEADGGRFGDAVKCQPHVVKKTLTDS